MKYFIHLPMKMEPIVSSETSAIKSQTPGNYPKRNKLQTTLTRSNTTQVYCNYADYLYAHAACQECQYKNITKEFLCKVFVLTFLMMA